MAFKGTTRAYKRMKNGMFWSEIAFKNQTSHPHRRFRGLPPPQPPPPRTEPTLFNISSATHARINEIKMKILNYDPQEGKNLQNH